MPSTSFAGGAVRVVVPASYNARSTRPGGRRSLPGEPGYAAETSKAAMLDSLREGGFDQVQSIDVMPKRERGLDQPTPATGGTVALDVDVAAGDDAVVLLERDGVYSWHLPVNPVQRTRDLDPTPRTARFEIILGDHPASPRTRGRHQSTTADRQTRGILGDLVRGAVQAIVLKFAAPLVVGKAIEALESHVQPGLLHLRDSDVSTWVPFATLADLNLPTDRPIRILLFIHGTFSSTAGGFGAFAYDENASGLLRTAIGTYDAVIGFDHKTLSVDPRSNAKDLLARLATHHPEYELDIDIITHSRGGLTTRSFVEYELAQSDWPGKVDHIVFVAATNGGTHLADPERWHDLIDLYTNLVAVGAGVLAVAPGAAPIAAVVGGVVKGIGALVKYLVSYAADGDGVPGLAAMMPAGDFVTQINQRQPGQPAAGTNWHVVSSNFHVELFDDSHHPPEFPRELVVKLKEGFVDQLFRGDNDLVVDTASMSAIDLPGGGGFVGNSLAIPTNDVVYHINYFTQLQVIEAIAGWLPLGMGAGGAGPDDTVSGEGGVTDDLPTTGPGRGQGDRLTSQNADRHVPVRRADTWLAETTDRWGGGDDELPMTTAEPPPPAPSEPPPPVSAPAPPPPVSAPAPPSLVDAHLAAEMPARPIAASPFVVRVRLSRKAITASVGTVSGSVGVVVDPDRPASVQVVGKRNATVTDPDRDVFGLPVGGGISELTFEVTADRPGRVVVMVIVRQGSVPVGTIELEGLATESTPTGTTTGSSTGVPSSLLGTIGTSTVSATGSLGLDAPELEGLPCLEVIETVHGDRVVYEYSLRLEQGGQVYRFNSPPLRDRETFVRGLLKQVEDLWVDVGDRPKRFLAAVQDLGSSLFEQLFPQEMQSVLWEHRDEITDLLLYADEPYMPWELVHLKPPVGPRQQKPRFLAQHGLVRWQFTGFPPKTLQARRGHVRSLIPDYLDPAFVLAHTAAESEFLTDRFGATPLPATPTGVRKLLRSGDFDLLHFAGHGMADPADIADAKVLLRGRRKAGAVVQEYLSATTVAENATWAQGGGARPIVVLNACQAGRGGEQLSTLGGFAKAFLQSGAGAFVSSLWSVGDEPARTFVEAFYDGLIAGEPVSVATVRAREAARAAGDATWLAYAVYARPDATLAREGAPTDGTPADSSLTPIGQAGPADPSDPSGTSGASTPEPASGAGPVTDPTSPPAGPSSTQPSPPAGPSSTQPAPPASPSAHPSPRPDPGSSKGSAMTSKALCVGINEFANLPMSSWLAGCVNDAHDIAGTLKSHGFRARDITVLTDAGATKAAVMGALGAMVDAAKPGDRLVFTYSSHGTQVPNQPGGDDEPDGLDEAFACYDIRRARDQWDPRTVILDDELHDLFARVHAGVLLEVLLDTCHSGTGLRDLDEMQQALLRGRRPRYLPPPTRKGLDTARSIRALAPPRTTDHKALVELTKRGKGARPVLFAACKPNQTASDARFDGKSNGAFTYLFLKALAQTPDASRAELLKAVTTGLKAEDFDQRSTLEGPVASKKAGFGQAW